MTNGIFSYANATNVCSLFDEVPLACETLILGHPMELLRGQMISEVDLNTALARRGIVAQKNTFSRKLIIDSGVFGGNSGGPLMAKDDSHFETIEYKIAGIMVQFVPVITRQDPADGITNSIFLYSGYSVAEPIDYALELMHEFEANESGTTTK